MAVASVSVILTVVVLKLHHCAPNQKKIPRWVRRFILGYLARIVRCSCVPSPSCLQRKRSPRMTDTGSYDPRDIQSQLLKEMESFSKKANGTNSTSRVQNSMKTAMNGSKVNLELKQYSLSEQSSLAPDDLISYRRDYSERTMDDILKYLKILVVKSDAEDAETEVVDEWKQVALVVDRLFFWLFLFATVVSSVVILVIVPSFKHIEGEGF